MYNFSLNKPSLTTLHHGLVVLGIAALISSILIWPETFLFGKTMRLPEFATSFPWPTKFPQTWILLFLIGPALTAPSFRRAVWSLVAVLFLSPALAVTVHPANTQALANGSFNVAWVAFFHGSLPLAVSLLTAGAAARFRQRPAVSD